MAQQDSTNENIKYEEVKILTSNRVFISFDVEVPSLLGSES
jgi:hypothetical protein